MADVARPRPTRPQRPVRRTSLPAAPQPPPAIAPRPPPPSPKKEAAAAAAAAAPSSLVQTTLSSVQRRRRRRRPASSPSTFTIRVPPNRILRQGGADAVVEALRAEASQEAPPPGSRSWETRQLRGRRRHAGAGSSRASDTVLPAWFSRKAIEAHLADASTQAQQAWEAGVQRRVDEVAAFIVASMHTAWREGAALPTRFDVTDQHPAVRQGLLATLRPRWEGVCLTKRRRGGAGAARGDAAATDSDDASTAAASPRVTLVLPLTLPNVSTALLPVTT